MGIYTTPTQLRLAQRDRFRKVGIAINQVHQELAEGGYRDFKEATLGPLKSETLAKMGHPYARLGGGARGAKAGSKSPLKGQITRRGIVKGLPINKQTGRLHNAILLLGPIGSKRIYDLASWVPYAKDVLSPTGTKKMVARGLLGNGHLVKRHKARLAAAIDIVRELNKKP